MSYCGSHFGFKIKIKKKYQLCNSLDSIKIAVDNKKLLFIFPWGTGTTLKNICPAVATILTDQS